MLYKSVELGDCRYYTTRLGIGTPPQEFALIVDTGSSATYVPCSSCEQCGKHQVSFLSFDEYLYLDVLFSGLASFGAVLFS